MSRHVEHRWSAGIFGQHIDDERHKNQKKHQEQARSKPPEVRRQDDFNPFWVLGIIADAHRASGRPISPPIARVPDRYYRGSAARHKANDGVVKRLTLIA